MTKNTLEAYLKHHGVAPWWENPGNLDAHARLVRVLFSDSSPLPSTVDNAEYDSRQLPSFIFAQMLLERSKRPRGFAQTTWSQSKEQGVSSRGEPRRVDSVDASSHSETDASPREPSERATSVVQSPNNPIPKLRPQNKGADSSAGVKEAPELDSVIVQDLGEAQTGKSSPTATEGGMLSKKEVADFLGVSKSTVDNYRKGPDFPEPLQIGKNTLLWDRLAIRKWMESLKSSTP